MSQDSFYNLQTFVQALRSSGELVDIHHAVDAKLEVAEIHRRVIAAGGPALMFHNVKGKGFPVVTNLFGSARRVDLAFGDRGRRFVERVAQAPQQLLPPSLKKMWGYRHLFWDALRIGFRRTPKAPTLECKMIDGPDLSALPALTSWSEDGGPFLTLPLVHTPGFDGHPDNLGMYRVQIFEPQEAGMHFQIGKGGGFHLFQAEAKGENLPVNIYLGGPPALIAAAIAPLPENVPELLLASMLAGHRLGRGRTIDSPLDPVAEAEFCICGHVPANVRRPEGPFGDHYGYYSLRHDYPVFRPHAIYHRKNAIFPATVVGKPRQEDFFLGDYLQEMLSPLFPLVMPGVRDLWSYGETGYHSLSAAVLKERYGRESMASVFRILGEGQLSLTKFLIAIDRSLDLKSFRDVLTYALERCRFEHDIFIFSDIAMDTLDYTGPKVNHGSKGVLIGMGEPVRELPRELTSAEFVGTPIKHARVFSPGCLVVSITSYKQNQEAAQAISDHPACAKWPLIVLVDSVEDACHSEASFLWTTFTRFEPAADMHFARTQIVRNKLSYQPPVIIDARMKPWYPKELFADDATKTTVDQNWPHYFPGGNVEMGDSDYGHLRM